jgi:sn-glycerol 3-phosphate transport system permease protein
MIERTPILNAVTHVILLSGVVLAVLPLWLVFVASTLTLAEVNAVPMPFLPGSSLWNNLAEAWARAGLQGKLLNSLAMAIGVTIGKVVLAALTAFAIVFFRFRVRMIVFWGIFVTLMLPLEVRIVPTYAVAANMLSPYQTLLHAVGIGEVWQWITGTELALEWNLLNSYTGLVLPLVATATGTFLYRQFFMTIPEELVESAKMDGAGPLRFLWDMLLPLSKTNMAALATIMFIYAWNQYLWPLLVTTDPTYETAVTALQRLTPMSASTGGGTPDWNVAMAAALLVMLPPLLLVIFMQRWFVRGLIAQDK